MLVMFPKTNEQRDSHLLIEIQAVQIKIPAILKYKVQGEVVPTYEKQKER
jgi:hypothetical protein